MERETWDSLLSFLLAINDALLAPPAVKDDVGDQLCERVLGVLYEIWLIACVKSFPGPTLWKTFQVVLLVLLDITQMWCDAEKKMLKTTFYLGDVYELAAQDRVGHAMEQVMSEELLK